MKHNILSPKTYITLYDGVLGRRQFFKAFVPIFLIGFLLFLLVTFAFFSIKNIPLLGFTLGLTTIISAFLGLFFYSLLARRAHDTGLSAWWPFALFFIPHLSNISFLFLFLWPPKKSKNKFGKRKEFTSLLDTIKNKGNKTKPKSSELIFFKTSYVIFWLNLIIGGLLIIYSLVAIFIDIIPPEVIHDGIDQIINQSLPSNSILTL